MEQEAPVIYLETKTEFSSTNNTYAIKGFLTDDNEVKHFSIFVGDDKVYYTAPSAEENLKKVSFDTKIPLKKGINFITLSAQDNRDLISKRQWVVWRAQ